MTTINKKCYVCGKYDHKTFDCKSTMWGCTYCHKEFDTKTKSIKHEKYCIKRPLPPAILFDPKIGWYRSLSDRSKDVRYDFSMIYDINIDLRKFSKRSPRTVSQTHICYICHRFHDIPWNYETKDYMVYYIHIEILRKRFIALMKYNVDKLREQYPKEKFIYLLNIVYKVFKTEMEGPE